jgi:two-component system response regulator NreC
MTDTDKLRIFLVDDHAAICAGLRILINMQPGMEVVGQAVDGRTALEKIPKCGPDVVLLDISLPNMSGAQTMTLLKQAVLGIRVLVLTRHGDQVYLRQMLEAGAAGYVLKRASAEELMMAIRTVASGGTYIDKTLTGQVVGSYLDSQRPKSAMRSSELSDREKDVLRLIAWGYSNKEIATKLRISVKTVEYYKTRSMEKLDYHSRTDIVRYALQQGWLQEG